MLLGWDEVSELRGGGRHSCLRRGWAGQLGLVSLSGYNQAGSVSLGESEKWNQSLVQPECRSQAGRTLIETERKEKISGDLKGKSKSLLPSPALQAPRGAPFSEPKQQPLGRAEMWVSQTQHHRVLKKSKFEGKRL